MLATTRRLFMQQRSSIHAQLDKQNFALCDGAKSAGSEVPGARLSARNQACCETADRLLEEMQDDGKLMADSTSGRTL